MGLNIWSQVQAELQHDGDGNHVHCGDTTPDTTDSRRVEHLNRETGPCWDGVQLGGADTETQDFTQSLQGLRTVIPCLEPRHPIDLWRVTTP